jgi:hypothetical protein
MNWYKCSQFGNSNFNLPPGVTGKMIDDQFSSPEIEPVTQDNVDIELRIDGEEFNRWYKEGGDIVNVLPPGPNIVTFYVSFSYDKHNGEIKTNVIKAIDERGKDLKQYNIGTFAEYELENEIKTIINQS